MKGNNKDRLTTILGLAVGIRQFLGVDYVKLASFDRVELARLIVGVVAILVGGALFNPYLSRALRGQRG